MQKRHVLVCEDSLCPKKQPDVSGPGLGEAGRYINDRTIERGSRVSSLTLIILALVIFYTCSIQSKIAQKNSRKHLEEQKVEERNNYKSTQLKTEKT